MIQSSATTVETSREERHGESPHVSVILCTWNNSHQLTLTLDSALQLEVPAGLRWELVVVNNNSTDTTDQVIALYADRLPLRRVFEGRQGLSRARNAGLEAAAGELIIFTDDDVRFDPAWLRTYWEAYQAHPSGYFFGGPVESLFEGTPPPPALMRFAPYSVRGLDFGEAEGPVPRTARFISANWACEKAALLKVGGFNPDLGLGSREGKVSIGEETELMDRLHAIGMERFYLPRARLRHFVPMSKCSVQHIGDRQQANVERRMLQEPGEWMEKWEKGWFCSLRLRLSFRYEYLWRRFRGRPGYAQYIHMRQIEGEYRAYRELKRRAQSSAANVAQRRNCA